MLYIIVLFHFLVCCLYFIVLKPSDNIYIYCMIDLHDKGCMRFIYFYMFCIILIFRHCFFACSKWCLLLYRGNIDLQSVFYIFYQNNF